MNSNFNLNLKRIATTRNHSLPLSFAGDRIRLGIIAERSRVARRESLALEFYEGDTIFTSGD